MSGMTQDEIRARVDEIGGRLKEINQEWDGQALPDAARDEFQKLTNERTELKRLDSELEARRKVIEDESEREQAVEPGFQVGARVGKPKGEEIYDVSTIRMTVSSPEGAVREMKDRAKVAIEQSDYAASAVRKEDAQSRAEDLLRIDHSGALAQRMLETGSREYMRAFGKVISRQPLTDSETRALSTTDASGGYAIPFTLDPTVIHTSNYSVNPYRAVAKVVQVTGDNWQGITSAGVSVEVGGGEGGEAADNSPSFGQPSIHPERWQAFVPFSVEIGQDWPSLQSEITTMIQEGKDDKEAEKFTSGVGSGSKEPEGVFVGGTATVTTAGTATFAVGDLYKVEQELPARHRPRASWIAKRNAYNATRQFDTSGGASIWFDNLAKGLGNQVPFPGRLNQDLLGYPTYECSAAPYGTGTGGTVLMFGDFSRYVIVDRIGMNVDLIPHLFGTANNRPTGERGLYAIWRNSAEVVDPNAFRKLKAL